MWVYECYLVKHIWIDSDYSVCDFGFELGL